MAGLDTERITVPSGPQLPAGVVLRRDVRSEQVLWIWERILPAGELTFAAGLEKLGKSTALLWAAARVTRGDLPGDLYGRPARVMFLSGEDSNEHVLAPRFDAAGGDPDLVGFLDPLGPGYTIEMVEAFAPALTVIDPVSMFVTIRGTNENSEMMVRQALAPFVRLARTTKMGIAGVRHLRKGPAGDNPYDSMLGSRAWSAAARAVMFFTPNPAHPDRQGGLIFPRGNLARAGEPIAYQLRSTPVDLDDGTSMEVPVFTIDTLAVNITLEEALGPREQATARTEAEVFLADLLAYGRVLADEAYGLADKAGISRRTLERAKKALGVTSEAEGSGPTRRWWWVLPTSPTSPTSP